MKRTFLMLAGLLAASQLTYAMDNPASDEFAVKVVSSAPNQVTGGDARLHILVPRTVPLHQAEVWVNGVDQRSHFSVMPGTRMLTGVIDGLRLGANDLRVKANGNGQGRPAAVPMTLTNYPITGPVFSGPHQYPFVCNDRVAGPGPADPGRSGHRHEGVRLLRTAWSATAATARRRRRWSSSIARRAIPGRTTRRAWRGRPTWRRRRPSMARRWTSSSAGSAARSTASSTASPCSRRSITTRTNGTATPGTSASSTGSTVAWPSGTRRAA